jgi:hypothetical protein
MQDRLMEMGIKAQKPSLFPSLALIVTTLTYCLQITFLSDVATSILDDSRNTLLGPAKADILPRPANFLP